MVFAPFLQVFEKKYAKYLVVQLFLVTFAPELKYMNKKDKLVKRFRNLPRDFTFEEMIALFKQCGFELSNKGATSGSRVEFIHERDGNSYIMHKPHPANIIKGYVMRQVLSFLTTNGYLKEKED